MRDRDRERAWAIVRDYYGVTDRGYRDMLQDVIAGALAEARAQAETERDEATLELAAQRCEWVGLQGAGVTWHLAATRCANELRALKLAPITEADKAAAVAEYRRQHPTTQGGSDA